jgi:antitoxin VapB
MEKLEKARVFMSGRSQAVRIPAAFRFTTEEVYIRRDPRSGAVTLSERPQRVPLKDVFAMIDAAGGAEELFRERDERSPEEREWM